MARRARHYISGMPYHIVQRGVNRCACFINSDDQMFYLTLWRKISRRYGVQVHTYCLMSNHVHVLATCGNADSISWTMRVVGSNYASFFNKKYQRTGTLWEGRHRASLIQSSRYLLNCYRYIEMNPVRAKMVAHPADYLWSGYAFNALGKNSWLTPHPEYLGLGGTRTARLEVYRQLFENPLENSDIEQFRSGLRHSRPVGDKDFIEDLRIRFGVEPVRDKPGRGHGDGGN